MIFHPVEEKEERTQASFSQEDDDANVLKDDSELAYVQQHDKGGKHKWGSTTMDPITQKDLFPNNTLLEVQAKTVVEYY